MPFNRLRQSLRILLGEKRITLINILGLTISLSCALFMLLWVQHELSYDRFHDDFRRLYRVEEDQYYSGEEAYHVNVTPYVSGPVWKEEVPEIEQQCRCAWMSGHLFTYGDQKYYESGITAVDSTFFDMFSYNFLYGDPESALNKPYSMVLTESLALKYFGDRNPVGEEILVNQENNFTVSAVIEDTPDNSILGFHILFPWQYIEGLDRYTDSWGTNSIQTFVRLRETSVDSVVSRKITEVTDKYKENNTIDYMVAPFAKIHLYSYFGYGHSPGAVMYVYIFSAIALFVLIIACINFMNLSTARSSVRAREIGLRKVNGASRRQIIRQTFLECFLQVLLSTLLAFLLMHLLLEAFNNIAGKQIEINMLFSLPFLLGIAGTLLLTTLLAGSYPALYLSRLKPVQAFRDARSQHGGSGLLRKILVVFQFSLAVILITGALVASRQLNFMLNADLGFDKNYLVHVQLRGNLNQEYEELKQLFLENPNILSATASIQPPYRIGSNSGGIGWEGKDPEQSLLVSFTGVHYDFIRTMDITLKEGRDFSPDFPSDMMTDTTASFIINQVLADIIGKEELLGMELQFMGLRGPIVGIMEDYHFQSLDNEIEPMAVGPLPADWLQHMIIRLSPDNPQGGLDHMKAVWEDFLPQYPFEYNYVDESLDNMYNSEERMASLFKIFTIVAILVAALGLFALASFMAQRRTREISIRKTLGAVEQQITVMLVRDFSLYILLSLLIGFPSIWLISKAWLNQFYFRISLGADLFIYTALLTIVVAVLTVIYHAFRIARTNPAEVLWHE